jgi:hypothetical protein
MNAINVNGDHHISRAEAESADIRVLGYSWGGTQAANFTRSINRVGKDVLGRKLDAPIAVRTLATIDPVEVFKLGPISIVPLKVTTGPVEANVGAFFDYYQQHPGVSTLVNVDAQGKRTGVVVRLGAGLSDCGGRFISGVPIESKAQASSIVRIDTDWGALYEDRDRAFPDGDLDPLVTGNEPIWRIYGNDVNHLSAVFYAFRRLNDALA